MKNKNSDIYKHRGITLIALIITIIVLLILAGVTLWLFSNQGPIEHAKMSKFATEFSEIEEKVELYIADKQINKIANIVDGKQQSDYMILPVLNELTIDEKEEIKTKNETLQTKIEELAGKTMDDVNLYWIDKDAIESKLSHKYIIDIDTRQIYDYQGSKIYGLMWHTLDGGVKKETSSDEEPPVIKVTADLENALPKVGIKIEVTDNIKVETVKWENDIREENYFENAGNSIQNNSIIYVTENGYYTIYASDEAGNKSIYTIQVENVNNQVPNITIEVIPDNTITTEVSINIEYGDSSIKQYKIGKTNTTWTNYEGAINLTSYIVLENNWQNEDDTVTIYAKGQDSSKNEIIVAQKILSLDLETPQKPIITSNYGYPVLTENGVKVDGETKITYDTRKDIDNYYSLDNGETWQQYTQSLYVSGGTIMAKSIKKSSGLEIVVSKEISVDGEGIGFEAYDGDKNTFYLAGNVAYRYMYVDESAWGKKLRIFSKGYQGVYFKDENDQQLYFSGWHRNTDMTYEIPEGTTLIQYYFNESGGIYEMVLDAPEDPIIETMEYPLLTEDGIKVEIGKINIIYDERNDIDNYYSVDNGKTWQKYTGSFNVPEGTTVMAKSVKKSTNWEVISSKEIVSPNDAIGKEAYDGDESTFYLAGNVSYRYMNVDESAWGKSLRILSRGYQGLWFLDENDVSLYFSNYHRNGDRTYVIPEGTKKIKYYFNENGGIYEMMIVD